MNKFTSTSLLLLSTAAGTFLTSFVGCDSDTGLAGNLLTESKMQGDNMQSQESSSTKPQILLAKLLADKAAESAANAPTSRKVAFKAGIDLVRDSGIEKSARQVGDAAVDGELIGWDGETVRLSDLWSNGPVILMWYRGGWCPYCNIQLRAMQQSLDEIKEAGAQLVVLTPELPEKAKETAATNDIDMIALHDRDNKLAQSYGIMFDLPEPIVSIYRDKLKLATYNGSDQMQLPLSATYVIESSGEITYAFLDADYKKRAEPSEVVEAVRAIAK